MTKYIIEEHPDYPYADPKPKELIECKNCKYFGKFKHLGQSFCLNKKTRSHPQLSLIVSEDFYCGFGERVEDDAD